MGELFLITCAITMKIKNITTVLTFGFLIFTSLQLSSCSFTPEAYDSLEKTLEAYERAIRWRNYSGAQAFLLHPEEISDFKRQRLINIRVTSYKTIQQIIAPDYSKAELIVDIRYYYDNSAIERVLTDRQVWLYEEEMNRWRLDTPFPNFQFK